MAEQQAGWYPDPSGDASKLRYWNGTQWTNDFTDAAQFTQQPAEPVQPEVAAAPAEPPAPAVPAEPVQPDAPAEPFKEYVPASTAEPAAEFVPVTSQPEVVADIAAGADAQQPFKEYVPAPTAEPAAEFIPVATQPEVVAGMASEPDSAQPFGEYVPAPTAEPAAEFIPAPATAPATHQPPAPMQPQTQVQPAIPVQSADASFTPPTSAPQAPPVGAVPSPAPAQPYPPMSEGSAYPAQSQSYTQGQGYEQKKNRAPLIIGIVVAAILIVAVIVGIIIFNSMAAPEPAEPETPTVIAPDTDTDVDTDADDSIEISGDVTGVVGEEYETMWFTFTVESMSIESSYADYTAKEGYVLVVAHITETNISGSTQPFGTFDWFVDDGSLEFYYYPLDPLNDNMMPERFEMEDDETASYDVVIEYPVDMANPYLMYQEVDEEGTIYTTFKIAIK